VRRPARCEVTLCLATAAASFKPRPNQKNLGIKVTEARDLSEHRFTKAEAEERAVDLVPQLGLPDP